MTEGETIPGPVPRIFQDRDTTTGEEPHVTMIEDPADLLVGNLGPIEVFAAGGVVWRPKPAQPEGSSKVEVLLVHRPRYDDWSIPKGKRDDGETDEDCARREVLEETGLRCKLGEEVAQSEYVDRKGRNKLVRYWEMTPLDDGELTVNDEVDELRWVSPGKAAKLVSYAADAIVVEAFADGR
jgi:8-oxo-dGTP diphosphatase